MAQGTTKGVPIDTDPLLAADSDLLVPSQKAVKTYVTANAVAFSSLSANSPLSYNNAGVFSISQASGSTNGYLSSTDFTTFNNKQDALSGTGFVKISGTTISYDNSTYLTSVGTGVTNEITYWSGTNTIASLSTSTYPSLTELSYAKGVTSAIQTQLNAKLPSSSYEWMWATGFQALGSTIKGINLGLPVFYSVGAAAVLTNGAVRFVPYYLANAATITGVKFYQANTASYTGNNYNGVGLYSYSGGTLTLVASSTNAASFWVNTINTWVSKPFSSPYSASAGVYYIGMMYSFSAQTTAPQTLAGSTVNVGFATVDFTNSAKIAGVSGTGLTALPSPTIAMSSINSTTNVPSIYLY